MGGRGQGPGRRVAAIRSTMRHSPRSWPSIRFSTSRRGDVASFSVLSRCLLRDFPEQDRGVVVTDREGDISVETEQSLSEVIRNALAVYHLLWTELRAEPGR